MRPPADATPSNTARVPAWLAALGQPVDWSAVRARVGPRGYEGAAWVGVLAVAALLRLAALGDRPLDAAEAGPALEAWRLWLGRPPAALESSALLSHVLKLGFGLLGASDVVARLPAVAGGVLLTLAPLLLRPVLGPLAAVGAGALLALSPLVVFASRRVDAAILVAALLALLVGVAVQAVTRNERRWASAVPVLAGLLLAAGSVAVPAALAVLAAAALAWWPARREGWARLRSLAPPPALSLGLFAATLVLVGTAGLTHLRGLQAALVDPWVSWLAPYYPRAVAIPWLAALLLYDLPLAGAAAGGLLLAVRRNRPFDQFLLWWAAAAALPLVFQPPDPVPYLLVWAVPLALLGGMAIGAVPALGWTWRGAAYSILLLALLAIDLCYVVNTTRLLASLFALRGGSPPVETRSLLASGLILLLLLVLHWRLARWGREHLPGEQQANWEARVGVLAALALGLVFAITVNGRLNYAHYGAGGAELLRPEALAPDLWELIEEVQAWGRQNPNTPIVVSQALRPSLLWHLRDVPTVQFHERPPAAGTGLRFLWPAGPDAPPGERRPWRETIAPAPTMSPNALWNWWLYRNAWLVPIRHDIIVGR
ncbi:MAG TPA: hypothetical protein VFB73_05055 [Chloroflexota bacterium]|nr:hypothetical protein [Chloroflexota bacterium]